MKITKGWILFILTIILFGIAVFCLGFVSGSYMTLNLAVEKADYFLEAQGVNLSIKQDVVLSDIFKYKNNIGGCWNAPIRSP